mgnify:CR=1 FL=1
MNRYPLWKYVLLGVVLLVGLLYTAPNFYGEAPAVQVSGAKATVKVDAGMVATVQQTLTAAKLTPDFVRFDGSSVRARFTDIDAQKKARDALLAARAGARPPVGAMLSIEGLQDIEGELDNLDRLHAAGFRMASLAHFFDNDVAGSMHGVNKGGLTPLGRQVVRRMEQIGMVVDIAHCSHQCVAEVLAMARRPVVSSHGGVQATCKVNRNLDDNQIRGVAATGGLVGIGYWDAAICDTSPASIAKAMKHVRDLVGIQYVALGSDYDGGTTVRFDTSKLVQVTQALLDEKFTPDEIRAVMGGNALRVLRAGMMPLGQTAQ